MIEARVNLVGAVDLARTPELLRIVEDHIASGAERIVFDCADLEFLDSSGIGVIALANRVCEVTVVNVTGHPHRALEIVGFTELIEET